MEKSDIGALWSRVKGDKEYMTGVVTIEGVAHEVVVFKNGFKTKPNQPDWRIYKPAPQEDKAAEPKPVVSDKVIEYPTDEINPDDIPF